MTQQEIILRCEGIHKLFFLNRKDEKGIEVLKGVGLEIIAGEMVTIVGASGAGKSTLLHILGGLDRPTEGKVFWREKDIFRSDDTVLSRLRAKGVGFVFQFHHLLQEFTSLENVALAALIAGDSMSVALEKAKRILGRIGLHDRIDHKPSELSGGEQQRVAVARALVNSPAIVLADEPSGNLDSTSAQQLHELIFDLNKSEGQTFIIVTHNQHLAQQSQRTLRIADGILKVL